MNFLLCSVYCQQQYLLNQNSELTEHFYFLFLMSHAYGYLESVLSLCWLVFFQTEFIAFELMFSPIFAKFPTNPQPVWACCSLLYFFFILLALSWVGVFARANLTFSFLMHLFCRPIVRVLELLCYKIFFAYSLIPYSKRFTVWQGNVQWGSLSSKYNFLSHCPSLLPLNILFNVGFATSPRNGATAEAISPSGRPLPLCFLNVFLPLFFSTTNLPNTFYRSFPSHSSKSSSVWLICMSDKHSMS